jgi:CheY-like chemotaxis protein
MTGKGNGISSSTTLVRRPIRVRQRVVLSLNDSAFAGWIARRIRRLGWGVHLARSGEEARRLCQEYSPQVVVLDTRLPDQSGWLTCEKTLHDDPTLKVILVASQPEPDGEAFAEFVGPAKLLYQDEGIQRVIDEIVAATTPVAD